MNIALYNYTKKHCPLSKQYQPIFPVINIMTGVLLIQLKIIYRTLCFRDTETILYKEVANCIMGDK